MDALCCLYWHLMLACEEEGKQITLFREDRTNTDMKDKKEMDQWRRRTGMTRWRRMYTRR